MSSFGQHRGASQQLSVNTKTLRKRSLKRSLSFEIPSPSQAGSGPGSWTTHYNSENFNQTHQQRQQRHSLSQQGSQQHSSSSRYNSSQAPRGNRNNSKYAVSSTSASSSSSSSSSSRTYPITNTKTDVKKTGTRATKQLKKARTWHPNATEEYNNAINGRRGGNGHGALATTKNESSRSNYAGLNSNFERAQQQQQEQQKNNSKSFTHQLNLSWSQAEHLVSAYQVINVNPLYYSANESPPKQPCMQKFMRGCDSIEVELEGPSFVTDSLFLGDRHDASDRRKMIDLGITHVINATRDIDNFFEGHTVGGRRIK